MSALRVVFLWSIFAGMGIGFGCRVLAQAPTGTSLPEAPSPVRSEPDAQGIYKIGGDVKAPLLTLMRDLDFGQEERRKEKDPRSGTTVVEMVVDVNGVPQLVHVCTGWGRGSTRRRWRRCGSTASSRR
jgi:hypothetical protein